ncbi:hypothetical protein SBOR_5082 [Sclerotinia borealis F-4128]|uniref:Uncharacterized protein n=1 Tax=Sclerotinia borealis (strain F-4128) TaxID=1432307 RepID=W9CIM5_SCLBF|nr:hypothetical protein SBOR_5082 [Sclerotinia borealis F-4128]
MADSLNTVDLGKFYAKNAVLRYGNREEVKGVEDIVQFFHKIFPLLKSMKHETVEIDRTGNKIYQSCFITYVVKNDPEEKQIKIPAFGKIFLVEEGEEEGKLARFEVFLDPSEVFERIEFIGMMERECGVSWGLMVQSISKARVPSLYFRLDGDAAAASIHFTLTTNFTTFALYFIFPLPSTFLQQSTLLFSQALRITSLMLCCLFPPQYLPSLDYHLDEYSFTSATLLSTLQQRHSFGYLSKVTSEFTPIQQINHIMTACLGDSYERFSVCLPTLPISPDASKQKYLDEYMEVGKKDRETGELTRFIVSNDEEFGLEVTVKEGFNYRFYDGVMIDLYDVHSGIMVWQKKYPKSDAQGSSQKDEKILIESIDHAIVEGQLRSKARLKLASLVLDDFIKPAANGPRRYPRRLEGLCIGVSKYKRASDINLTKDEWDEKVQAHESKLSTIQNERNDSVDTLKRTAVHRKVYQKHMITHKLRLADGVVVPDEDIEKYLIPPSQTKKLFRYSDTQNFYYLWRGKKFFDTTAIAQTPIAPIRQSWDLLSSKEREKAYGELSKHDFQQIWLHHYKALGPKPKIAAIDALKRELRKNLPDYWRSWNKLYSYEIPAAFKKLQERRRYLDKGEIPEDSEVVGKTKVAAIDLESKPERLEKLSENVRVPSLTMGLAGASRGSGSATLRPKPAEFMVHESELTLLPQPNQTAHQMSSVAGGLAQVQPTLGDAIFGHSSALTGGSIEEIPECTERASTDPSHSELSSSATTSPSVIKSELTSQAPKRPAELIDLTRRKRPSLFMKPSLKFYSRLKSEHTSNQSILETSTTDSLLQTSVDLESRPLGSGATTPVDSMDIDTAQKVSAADLSISNSLFPDSSIPTLRKNTTPSSQSEILSTSTKIKRETSQPVLNATAEPVDMAEILSAIRPLKSEPSIENNSSPNTPVILPSASQFIPVSAASRIKSEESEITTDPVTQLKSDTSSEPELSHF